MTAQLRPDLFYRQAFAAGLMPDPLLTVSQWADEHRKLDPRGSPEPGQWRTSRTPYLREIMDNMSITSPVVETVVMKGAQLGFTEAANNMVGYVIHHAPGPGLFLEPSQDLAGRNVRQKINPMITITPALAERVPAPRSKDGGNTLEEKEFPGGIWLFKWASSTGGLRSSSIRFLVLDEIDEYAAEVGQQGDPETLARKRTNAYGRRKKIYIPSTPTVEGQSRIAALYEDSDQRRYRMPCPCCGERIEFLFSHLRVGVPGDVHYECQACQGRIEEWQKTAMLEAGEWVPANPSHARRGYHLSSLYSPVGWQSWEEIAEEWRNAQGKPDKLKAFVNTVLGETWKDRGEAPEWQRLYNRREDYPLGVVPAEALIITAAADVQRGPNGQGWIDYTAWAWGRNMERWLIDYQQYHGDTSDESAPTGPWAELTKRYLTPYPHAHAGVALPVRKLAVDSGDQTQTVYRWCAGQNPDVVMAIKGVFAGDMLVGVAKPIQVKADGTKAARATKLWTISKSIGMPELHNQLRYELDPNSPVPKGYMHFPEVDQEFFLQLTAYESKRKLVKGKMLTVWDRTRPRAEVADTTLYARAAANVLGLDRYMDADWEIIERQLGIGLEERVKTAAPETPKNRPKRPSIWRKR